MRLERMRKWAAWKLGRTFDKALGKLARWRGKPITIPDGDGGEVTYFPTGGYSHRT